MPLFLDALDGEGLSVGAFEEAHAEGGGEPAWRLEILHRARPDHRALAARLAPLAERAGLSRLDLESAPLPPADWLARTAESFPAQQIGRFWIHGSHIEATPPHGSVPILIDAGLAFGSGEHPTTRGCLQVLDRLARRRRLRRVLDLGCGSGILAIAAARTWPARVLAVDNDPDAVAVAAGNAGRNGVAARVRCLHSEGFANPRVRASGPYDLILANILADPLRAMAEDLARALAPRGLLVLSGLLETQAEALRSAFRAHRLRPLRAVRDGPWTTLALAPMTPGPRPNLGVRR